MSKKRTIVKRFATPDHIKSRLKKPDPQFQPRGTYRPVKDVIEVMTREEMEEALKKDAESSAPLQETYVGSIYNQESFGSCASEACVGGLSFVRVQAGFPHIEFNPYSVYCFTGNDAVGRRRDRDRDRRGHPDQGSSLIETIDWLQEHGVNTAEDWPRSNGINKTPPWEIRQKALSFTIQEAYPVETDDEMRSCLLRRIPVLYASEVHAKLAIRMKDINTFIYLNSWGKAWGNSGLGEERFDSVEGDYGRYVIRTGAVPAQINL